MDFMKESLEATRLDRSNELSGSMVEKTEKDELTKTIENYVITGGIN